MRTDSINLDSFETHCLSSNRPFVVMLMSSSRNDLAFSRVFSPVSKTSI